MMTSFMAMPSGKGSSGPAPAGPDSPRVVGIGGSAGALPALQDFFDALPGGKGLPDGTPREKEAQEEDIQKDPGFAIVVVMHLAPEKRSDLAEILGARTSLPVTQVTQATLIEENRVYVTAPGRTLLVEGTTLVPHELGSIEERRFPIDQFFRSLANAPVESIGVVLSGAGTDGSVGLRRIKEAGGLIAVQDPSEARHDSMPRSAIQASRADLVLPVGELARRLSASPRVVDQLPRLDAPEEAFEDDEDDEDVGEYLRDIFEEVRTRTGRDFRQYKPSTMLRRIRRRLQVHELSSLSGYLSYLKEHPSEATALLKDCLISVTNFFRDPAAFAALREQVVPEIVSERPADGRVRVWTIGCATGEEAYSLAMLVLEEIASQGSMPSQLQVFATDLDEEALAVARRGRYPEAVAADVPDRYLERFFWKDGDEYVVRPEVRDQVLFTTHDLLADPPFSKLDLVSCRNLLIYLQRELQEKVFAVLGYALHEGGYLFLGSSESPDPTGQTFETVDKAHRLYRRHGTPSSVPDLPSDLLAPSREVSTTAFDVGHGLSGASDAKAEKAFPQRGAAGGSSEAVAHRRLLEAYAPPSAVVGADYRLVHLSRNVGRFLRHPGGMPNKNIVDLVRPELKMTLRSALREAFSEGNGVQTRPTGVKFDGETRSVRLLVRPAQGEFAGVRDAGGLALVLFEVVEADRAREAPPRDGAPRDGAPSEEAAADDRDEQERTGQDGANWEAASEARGAQLEAELKQTKEELRATIEEHETSKQEMRAANEELRSMNEEYRSTAEELETSKEELQSVNEELKSVNRELEDKLQALKKANADLENLMAATDIGTLFLDEELQIQRYTPRIEKLFNVRPEDEGRPVGDLTHRLDYDRLVEDARDTLQAERTQTEATIEREVQSERGQWFLVRFYPYRTAENEVEGVVGTFVDITRRKEAEERLRRSNEVLQKRTQQVANLTRALTSAEEDERRRLSEVLHDRLQQTLVGARLQLSNVKNSLSQEQRAQVEGIIKRLRQGAKTARTLSQELDPPVEEESLSGVLEWLALQMDTSYDLEVDFTSRGTIKTADKSLRVLLFRLTKELLFNAVKHADVDEAVLTLEGRDDRFQVTVEDKGKGFDPAILEDEKGGQGLISVRDRIEMIGGTLEVDAAPGEGTRVTIDVPWHADAIGKDLNT